MTEFPTRKPHKKPAKKSQHSSLSAYLDVIRRLPPRKKQQFFLFCGGCVLALVLIIVLLVKLISPSAGGDSSLAENIPSDVSGSIAAADKDYNKDANSVDKSQYKETILEESADAGQDYIDETLFIGDSNTARMMSYGFTTLENDVGTVSMGIQHVTSKKCAFFKGYENGVTIPQAVKLMQPRRIIITFGTNNTIGWNADTFTKEYKKALDAIHEAYPSADLIINSIPPVHQYRDNPAVTMQTIDSFNKALVTLAKEEGYKFLNSSEVLKDEKTGFAKWDYTISDGIHMNKEAMTALFEYIRTHSYITEDDRPALSKVPARLEAPYDIITKDPLATHAEKTPAPSATPEVGEYTIKFSVEDASHGTLEGTATQQLNIGQKTTLVKAVPAKGYIFSHWSINVGSIPDNKNPEVIFELKMKDEKNVSIVAHFTASATPSPTPSASPTPTPTVTPSPTPTVTPTPPPATPTPPPSTPTPPPATPVPPPETATPIPPPPVSSDAPIAPSEDTPAV